MAVAEVLEKDQDIEVGADWECPICGKDPPFNDEARAAMEECRAMRAGKIPVTWYNSAEEMLKALND